LKAALSTITPPLYFELKKTAKTITEDNAVNLSISNMKEYMQEQVSDIFQEINCLRTRLDNTQNIHEQMFIEMN
jgi:hypothetical protein